MISSPPLSSSSKHQEKNQQQFPQRQKSKVIPIRPWKKNINDDGDEGGDNDHNDNIDSHHGLPQLPPDYAMIELNGELLPPVQYPTIDQCRTVLGNTTPSTSGERFGSSSSGSIVAPRPSPPVVELGQIQLDGDDQVRAWSSVLFRFRLCDYSIYWLICFVCVCVCVSV